MRHSKNNQTLREMANEEKATTSPKGVDPENPNFQWPRDMPAKFITVRDRTHEATRHVIRGMRPSSPRKRMCPICSKAVPMDDSVCELYYEQDSQVPFAAWIYERITRCQACGDRHHFETVWIMKPPAWDQLFPTEAHNALDEPTPVEVAYSSASDPDNDEMED